MKASNLRLSDASLVLGDGVCVPVLYRFLQYNPAQKSAAAF
jgi:hypothetical protein